MAGAAPSGAAALQLQRWVSHGGFSHAEHAQGLGLRKVAVAHGELLLGM